MQRVMANNIMNEFKEHPNSWQVVDKVLDVSNDANTKFYAL